MSAAMNEKIMNRLVLRHAADLNGIPQGLEDFSDMLRGRGVLDAETVARRCVQNLDTLEYLKRAEAVAADDPVWVITACGLRQIQKQVRELDPMIW